MSYLEINVVIALICTQEAKVDRFHLRQPGLPTRFQSSPGYTRDTVTEHQTKNNNNNSGFSLKAVTQISAFTDSHHD